jgi:hypothetical protein
MSSTSTTFAQKSELMKKVFLLLAIACCIQYVSFAQLRMPAASPAQTIKQDFGLSFVEVSYSRPAMKGRKVFGDLVPFGNVWRTGANQATTVNFGDEVTIGGTKIAAGKYGLVSIPEKSSWTLILTKQLDVTSPTAYKKENDVVRVSAKTAALKDKVENFTIQFANVKPSSADLQLMWETTMVSLPIKTDVDSKVMAQLNTAMSGEKPPYFAAASYYFENGKDLSKAKEWAQKAVESDPKAFYMHHLLAKIQAKSGEKSAAITTARKSIELAKEAKNEDYVALNEKLIKSLQ